MANVKLKNASGTEVTYNGVTSVTLPTAEGGTATFGTPSLQSKTATPTSSAVNVTPDSGYDGLSQVSVEAVVASNLVAGNIKKDVVVKVGTATDDDSVMTVTGTYEGSGGGGIDPSDATATAADILYPKTAYIADGSKATGTIQTKTASDVTTSGDAVNVLAGYYATAVSKSVAAGTEGTPTATKGTVSNHSVTVTPSVTNQAGYIAGGTHTGTAVTVSASELVSGTKSIVANGTGIDVVGYATVDVAVPSSGTDVSDTTATDGDVLAGKDFHLADGSKATGTIQSQAAQTIYPSLSDQTIAAGKYLAGAQTIKAVAISQTLVAANVAQGVTVDIGDADDPDRLVHIVGTHQGGGGVDIETLNVTENGTYNSPSGKAYGTVVVAVPQYDWKGGTRLWNYSMYAVLTKTWEE